MAAGAQCLTHHPVSSSASWMEILGRERAGLRLNNQAGRWQDQCYLLPATRLHLPLSTHLPSLDPRTVMMSFLRKPSSSSSCRSKSSRALALRRWLREQAT